MPVLPIKLENSQGTKIKKPRFSAKVLGIVINNNDFLVDQEAVEVILIDNRDLESLLIHFFNNAGTNSFDYEISGHADEVDVPPALTVAPKDWFVIPNGTGTVTNDKSDGVNVTDDWAWIVIRLKRTVSNNDSIADVFIRGLIN